MTHREIFEFRDRTKGRSWSRWVAHCEWKGLLGNRLSSAHKSVWFNYAWTGRGCSDGSGPTVGKLVDELTCSVKKQLPPIPPPAANPPAAPAPAQTPDRIHARDVTFDTFRAGGPGGQHHNTTDSAVRATHRPTGLTAAAREERSQHRNKSLALERLHHLMAAQTAIDEAAQKARHNELHHALERGNPVRCFKGHTFREVKGG